LLNSPEVRNAMKGLLGDQGNGADLGALLESPEFQKMVEQMLGGQKEAPKGQAAEGVYTNEKLGLRIREPKGAGWKTDAAPAKPPMGPTPLVEFSSPGSEAKVMVAQQALPMVMPIDQMAPMIEMGLQSQFKEFKKVKSGMVKVGQESGLELEYSGIIQGKKIHALQRIFLGESGLVVVAGTTEEENWEKHGPAVKESVESFEFVPKKGGAEPEKKPAPELAPAK
jgi:hypothetical protein